MGFKHFGQLIQGQVLHTQRCMHGLNNTLAVLTAQTTHSIPLCATAILCLLFKNKILALTILAQTYKIPAQILKIAIFFFLEYKNIPLFLVTTSGTIPKAPIFPSPLFSPATSTTFPKTL